MLERERNKDKNYGIKQSVDRDLERNGKLFYIVLKLKLKQEPFQENLRPQQRTFIKLILFRSHQCVLIFPCHYLNCPRSLPTPQTFLSMA